MAFFFCSVAGVDPAGPCCGAVHCSWRLDTVPAAADNRAWRRVRLLHGRVSDLCRYCRRQCALLFKRELLIEYSRQIQNQSNVALAACIGLSPLPCAVARGRMFSLSYIFRLSLGLRAARDLNARMLGVPFLYAVRGHIRNMIHS